MTPRPAAQILLIAVDEIGRVLSEGTASNQDRMTACDPWTVRDVLAHCSGSMLRTIEDRTHRFTPEDNELDVEERRSWDFDRVRDELQTTAHPTAARIDAAGGPLDGLGLGVWVHAGDIRDALGIDDPYHGPGIELGLGLLAERSRRLDFRPTMMVGGQPVEFGSGPDKGTVTTDAETFVRLTGGRTPDPARYRIEGLDPTELVLFG
jgi:uncharacterized protein (TIGR03083 family)